MKLSCLIRLQNIVKQYQMGDITNTVLHGLSLEVYQTELVAIVGASGSGKSTLMNIIGLLDKPTFGNYFLNEQDLSSISMSQLANIRNKQIGFIFQSFFLLPRLTALQNVYLPLTYREQDLPSMKEAAYKALRKVGMEHLANRYPRQLSGGQQQRVAIARALVGEPAVILADEPTGALDSKMSQEIMDLFVQLNIMDKRTIIVITHDEKIANQCHRIVKIEDGRLMNAEDKV